MIERSADQLDIAADLQDQANEQALANFRKSDKPQAHPDFDGAHCLDCGDDMPELRLQMHRIRCTSCETVVEQARNFRR